MVGTKVDDTNNNDDNDEDDNDDGSLTSSNTPDTSFESPPFSDVCTTVRFNTVVMQ